MEEIGAIGVEENEIMKNNDGKQALKRKIPKYYDRQQQLELMLATQELYKFGDHDLGHINFDEKENVGRTQRTLTFGRTQLAWSC
jgi:hypothetical protein